MTNRTPTVLLALFGVLAGAPIEASNTEYPNGTKAGHQGPPLPRTRDPVVIAVETTAPGERLRHVWQYYGYDECNYTTSRPARELMKTLASINPEPVYLRQHFLLVSGDGTPSLKWGSTNSYTENPTGKPLYDWRIMDEIMDAVVGSGCRPLVEIGFMPKALSIKPEPYKSEDPFKMRGFGPYYPPRDYEKWAALIEEWARHSKNRYPGVEKAWMWELWNEPNISYWQGSFEEYCKLFDYTEHALHKVMPGAALGGPHTAGTRDAFLRKFLEHSLRGKNAVTGQRGARLDYIGFHSKGSTRFVNGHPQMNLGLNLGNIRHDFSTIASFPEFCGAPVIIGECDPEGAAALSARVHPANGYRNGSAYAAYEVALMKHTLELAAREGVNLQGVLTWAFMFEGKDYFEGFRTLSTNAIHKPVLNAFKLLGILQGNRIPVTSTGALGIARILEEGVRDEPDIDGLAAAPPECVQVILWNYHDDMIPVEPASVRLRVKAPASNPSRARVVHYRIDDSHSNAYTRWVRLGSPQNPPPDVLVELRNAAELELLEPMRFADVCGGEVELNFTLPRYAVSLVELRWRP
jgi:xylan 1,4-beta-xylosidase